MGRVAPVALLLAAALPAAAQPISAPVLNWQRGGCFPTWCQTGCSGPATPSVRARYATLAVEDLEGDGRRDIVVGRASAGETRQVNACDASGNVRPGWPARHDGEPGYGWGMFDQNVTVAGVNRGEKAGNTIGQVHVLDGQGNALHAVDLPGSWSAGQWNGGLGAPTILFRDGLGLS